MQDVYVALSNEHSSRYSTLLRARNLVVSYLFGLVTSSSDCPLRTLVEATSVESMGPPGSFLSIHTELTSVGATLKEHHEENDCDLQPTVLRCT